MRSRCPGCWNPESGVSGECRNTAVQRVVRDQRAFGAAVRVPRILVGLATLLLILRGRYSGHRRSRQMSARSFAYRAASRLRLGIKPIWSYPHINWRSNTESVDAFSGRCPSHMRGRTSGSICAPLATKSVATCDPVPGRTKPGRRRFDRRTMHTFDRCSHEARVSLLWHRGAGATVCMGGGPFHQQFSKTVLARCQPLGRGPESGSCSRWPRFVPMGSFSNDGGSSQLVNPFPGAIVSRNCNAGLRRA